MENFAIFLLKANIILILGYLFYQLFLKRLTTHLLNRIYLVGLGTISLILPFLKLRAPGTDQALFTYDLPEIIVGQAAVVETSWKDYLLMTYAIGAGLSLLFLLFGFIKLMRQLRKAQQLHHEKTTLYIHPDFEPSSFFGNILLAESPKDDKATSIIIAHENAHVQLFHSMDVLFFQVLKIIFWFNPFIYFMDKTLREIHEYQADALVTKQFSRYEYGLLLLERVAKKPLLVLNHFNQFSTKNRILMMNKPESSVFQKATWALTLPLIFGFFLINNFEIQAQTQKIEKTEIEAEEIYDVVEEFPIPEGGMEGWSTYLKSNLKYPEAAKEAGIEGTVYVVFVITKTGEIENVEIIRGIGGGCDEEAMRVVRNAPKWTPGKQRGQEMNVRMRLPIRFKS
jgi:TonB family protein